MKKTEQERWFEERMKSQAALMRVMRQRDALRVEVAALKEQLRNRKVTHG